VLAFVRVKQNVRRRRNWTGPKAATEEAAWLAGPPAACTRASGLDPLAIRTRGGVREARDAKQAQGDLMDKESIAVIGMVFPVRPYWTKRRKSQGVILGC